MKNKEHTAEEIIKKLREAESELANEANLQQVCRNLGISKPTYYRWRRKYGMMETDEARRFKQMERENLRLKKIIAEQALDISLLKEVVKGKF